ncbi:hypothetical protein GF378_02700 [Candidatus Pacearchaeota archaeon]|nr:hypothetical protein [Candidatus Pacearchaeota archaeon]
MAKRNKTSIITVAIIILLILGVWGFIGGQQSEKIGITCDFGIGDTLCWKWHKNIVGQTQEALEDAQQQVREYFEQDN